MEISQETLEQKLHKISCYLVKEDFELQEATHKLPVGTNIEILFQLTTNYYSIKLKEDILLNII